MVISSSVVVLGSGLGLETGLETSSSWSQKLDFQDGGLFMVLKRLDNNQLFSL